MKGKKMKKENSEINTGLHKICARDAEKEPKKAVVFDIEKERAIKELCQILRSLSTEFCLCLVAHIKKRKPNIENEGFKSNSQQDTAFDLYAKLKLKYHDCILLFLLGDYYEAFYESAEICSEILRLPLNSRTNAAVPVVSIPCPAVNGYVNKLLQAGYKVGLCEQIKDRDVIRIVTPESFSEQNKP